MILTRNKSLVFPGRFRQRGSIILATNPLLVAGEVITLSGINGTPVIANELVTDTDDAECSWEFRTNGELWQERFINADSQYQDGVEWSDEQPTPGQDYWIKATQSGVTDPGDVTDYGTPLDNWDKVSGSGSATRAYGWIQASVGNKDGTVRVDIATDSGGSNVVATGYYKVSVTVIS